jgi:hypothetical protein
MKRAFEDRWLAMQPTDLPEPERQRRAAQARKTYYAQLTFKSIRARAQRKSSPSARK